MIKNYNSLKKYFFTSLLFFSSVIVCNAQYLLYGTQKIAYKNDTVLLHVDKNVRGDIQWEASKDKVNWTILSNKTNDTLLFKVDSSAYYRARITEGTCDPVFSEVVLVAQVYDDRDRQFYDAVKIGNQWWMAENLRYNNPAGSSYYDNDSIGYAHYGKLYTWEAANSSCPSGWHLPSDAEWKTLEITIGLNASVVDEPGWRGTNQAYSLFYKGSRGFDILFGGQLYHYGSYGDKDTIATFWSSEQTNAENAWYRGFNITHGDIHRDAYSKNYGYSVRCIRNSNPEFSLDSISFITDTSGVAFVNIYYDGGLNILEKGVCWGLSPNPDTTGNLKSAGSGSASFVLPISQLSAKTGYYIRAYLKTNDGIKYSNEKTFTTGVKLPVVLTSSVSDITTNSATSGGNITAAADITILSRGVCWSIIQHPTINDSKTINGSGAGSFSGSITGLSPNTKYYVRAYATVDGGVAYGNENSFSTSPLNETGTMVDSRDGKLYKTVRIGNQWWMAENLRFYKSGSWFYDDDSASYSQYGRLYNWQTANTLCPSGWHLPSDNEWKILESTLGMHVMDVENVEWRGTNQASELFTGGSTGYNIKFGGMRYADGTYIAEGSIAAFWSSTQFDTDNAWYRGFNTSHTDIHRYYYSKNDGYSVRCIKNMPAEILLDSIGLLAVYSGTAYVNLKSDGGSPVTERGVCWSTSSTPVYSGDHFSSGSGTGIFSIPISGLAHSTTYRVRAYARNSEGLTYSNELTFSTKVALPTVTTTALSSLTSNSVSSGGSVAAGTDVTVLSRGVCWSTMPNPTINNSKTTNGTGTGTFTSSVTDLSPNIKYYLRAYATVAGGVAYGNGLSFTTLPLNETGTMTDSRDGNIYKTVRIGNQWWMAENLKYYRSSGSWYYDNDSVNNHQNGRLYNYQTALNSCPSGWHLPTDNEWKTMEIALGVAADDAELIGWRGTNQALSLFTGGPIGFDIKFAGQYYPYGAFGDKGSIGAFWTSTEHISTDAWYRGFNLNHGDIHRYAYSKDYGYSVRCLKNAQAIVVLDSIGQIAEYSSTAYINITYDGGTNISERGVCWGTSQNPLKSGNHISSGSGTGIFNIPISSLQQATTYYARAYAVNSLGDSYSSQITFTTKVALPAVTTTAISSIAATSASSGGTVTAGAGITVTGRGVCWSTNPAPTTANSKTSNGTGAGTFTSTMTSLSPNTKYYLRAYATVSGGVAYGNEVSFTTLPANQTGTITDTRDGKVYKTVQMGTQWWMAENIRYYTANSWFYSNDSTTYSHYGKLYNYQSALTVCPSGWHLPSDYEWKVMEYYLGITDTASTSEWRGTDQANKLFSGGPTGYNILFGGQFTNGFYNSESTIGSIWTSTESGTSNAWYRGFNIGRGDIHRVTYPKDSRFSVRCMKHMQPNVTTASVTVFTDSSLVAGGNVTYNGGTNITARGICIGTTSNPTILNDTTNNGTGTGQYTSYKKGLNPNTLYYVRAYATNSAGTSYGTQTSFTTAIGKPKVATTLVSSITDSTAVSGGNVTSNGGETLTARGVCWGTSQNPIVGVNETTQNGTSTGTFSSTMINLQPKTKYYYRAYATNSAGTGYGAEYEFTTEAGLPNVTTESVTEITDSTATGGGNVLSAAGEAVTARGICWSLSQNPITSDSCTVNGAGTGSFTSQMKNLQPNKTYYVRAYATNSKGTAYGNQVQFLTSAALPQVTTGTISSITSTAASGGGNVISDGGSPVTVRGVCWSTTIAPTTSDPKTENGAGTGSYTSNITGLTRNLKYYVRAYATNIAGTVYGDTVSFHTPAELPTLTTTAISLLTDSSVWTGGTITNDGGASVISRGVCWNTTGNPTEADDTTLNGTGATAFSSFIKGLNSTTTYYVRAYAQNSAGYNYGNQIEFKTLYETDSLTDIRDNQKYVIVKIGTDWWLGENLNYNVTGSVYYGDSAAHAETYGRLYTWAAMMNGDASSNTVPSGVQGVCPTGWHIPGNTEWNNLITALGGDVSAGSALKETGNAHWNSPNSDATNETGFSARPAGIVNAALTASEKGLSAYFWTTTESDTTNANSKKLINNGGSVTNSVILKTSHASVRCIKNP